MKLQKVIDTILKLFPSLLRPYYTHFCVFEFSHVIEQLQDFKILKRMFFFIFYNLRYFVSYISRDSRFWDILLQ